MVVVVRKENKENYYQGFNAIHQITTSVFVLYIFVIPLWFFKGLKIGNFIYRELSIKRKVIPISCNNNCSIQSKIGEV